MSGLTKQEMRNQIVINLTQNIYVSTQSTCCESLVGTLPLDVIGLLGFPMSDSIEDINQLLC